MNFPSKHVLAYHGCLLPFDMQSPPNRRAISFFVWAYTLIFLPSDAIDWAVHFADSEPDPNFIP